MSASHDCFLKVTLSKVYECPCRKKKNVLTSHAACFTKRLVNQEDLGTFSKGLVKKNRLLVFVTLHSFLWVNG